MFLLICDPDSEVFDYSISIQDLGNILHTFNVKKCHINNMYCELHELDSKNLCTSINSNFDEDIYKNYNDRDNKFYYFYDELKKVDVNIFIKSIHSSEKLLDIYTENYHEKNKSYIKKFSDMISEHVFGPYPNIRS